MNKKIPALWLPSYRKRRSLLAFVVVAWAMFSAAWPAVAQSELDLWIGGQMDAARVPGLTAAVVRNGEQVWGGQYGLRNTDTASPVEAQTPFLLASVSKLVAATALMHLFDAGAFELDESIENHLQFSARHPDFPGTPITFRRLLMHLGSIEDDFAVIESLVVDGDSPMALGDLLFDYLDPAGDLYDAEANFGSDPPGTHYAYSNMGYALVGYLVESIAGIPFDQYCRTHLFTPLGLQETGWFLADFEDLSVLAKPHEHQGGGSYSTVEHYGFPDYPNGQLRSSARDMAAFMGLFLRGGIAGGGRILEASTVELMFDITFPGTAPDQGLGFYWDRASGRDVVGHNGGEVGVYSDLFLDPSRGIGVVVVANAEPNNPDILWGILERLFEEAPSFQTSFFADDFETGALGRWTVGRGP